MPSVSSQKPVDGGEKGREVGGAGAGDQLLRLLLGGGFAEQEHDLRGLAGLQLQPGLQRAAGVVAGADRVGQRRVAGQGQRSVQRAVAADELAAVAGPGQSTPAGAGLSRIGGAAHAQIGEGHAGAEIETPRVARQQGAGLGIHRGGDERRRGRSRAAQHPFDIGGDRHAACPSGAVGEGEAGDLHRVGERHELQQVEGDAVRLVLEATVALAVAGDVAGGLADRQRGRAPEVAGLLVADVEGLAGRIAHRIVRPGREVVLLAVHRPGGAAALGRDLEAEAGVADHVEPGRRRGLAVIEDGDVFTAALGKAAQAVEELERRQRRFFAPAKAGGDAAARRRRGALVGHRGKLFGEAAIVAGEHRAGGAQQQGAGVRRHEIGAQHGDGALAGGGDGLRRLPVGADQLLDRRLERLGVGVGLLVQDHQIHRELLGAPVFMRREQLSHEIQIGLDGHAGQHDRQVAGDAVLPQQAHRGAAAGQHRARRAQRRVGVDHPAGDALEQVGVLGDEAEIA